MDRRGGQDDPDSPLTFAMPQSLQDYMSRFMSIGERHAPLSAPAGAGSMYSPAALSPPTFPTRHWFDDTTTVIHTPPSPIVPDGGTTTATVIPTWSDTPNQFSQISPSFASEYHDDVSTRRGSPSHRPLLGQIDSFCDDDDARLNAPIHDRGRPQTRWGSRSRPSPSSTPRERLRRLEGGLGDRESGAAGGSSVTPQPRPTQSRIPSAPASDSAPTEDIVGQTRQLYVDERPMHQYGGALERRAQGAGTAHGTRSRGGEGQRHNWGRRTLADFLSEIEEMVRSQRSEAAAAEDRPRPSLGHIPNIVSAAEVIHRSPHTPIATRPARISMPPAIDERAFDPMPRRPIERNPSYEPLRANYTWPGISDWTSVEIAPTEPVSPLTVDGRRTSVPAAATATTAGGLTRSPLETSVTPAASAAMAISVETEREDMVRASNIVRAGARSARLRRPAMRRRLQTSSLPATPLQVSPAETAMRRDRSVAPDTMYYNGPSNYGLSSSRNGDGSRGRGDGGREVANNWRSSRGGAEVMGQAAANWRLQREGSLQFQYQQQRHQSGRAASVAGGDNDAMTVTVNSRFADDRRTDVNRNLHAASGMGRSSSSERSVGPGTTGGIAGPLAQEMTHSDPPTRGQQRAFLPVVDMLVSTESYMPPIEQPSNVNGGEIRGVPAAGGRSGFNRESERTAGFAAPTFSSWGSETNPRQLRIQWEEADAELPREQALPSDGIITVAERRFERPSSEGISPSAALDGIPRSGREPADASDVERALFGTFTCLGIRRLLFRGGEGDSFVKTSDNSPAWLNQWISGGAPAPPERYSGTIGEESRCPRVDDVWELLQVVLEFWAERVRAVHTIFSSADGSGSAGMERGDAGVPKNVSSAATAVEAVQDLRELGEHVMPLSCVRAFINIGGGPTPRDAVLLKTLLVIHEGIAWATGCPYYTYYRDEVIPTALALYACLPQDTLEGVDLEVGHMLPEIMFVISKIPRPFWPRWGGSGTPGAITDGNDQSSSSPALPPSHGVRERPTVGSWMEGNTNRGGGDGVGRDASRGGGAGVAIGLSVEVPTGVSTGFSAEFSNGNSNSVSSAFPNEYVGGDFSNRFEGVGSPGRHSGGGVGDDAHEFPVLDGDESFLVWESLGRVGNSAGERFVRGPWVVFRVKREEYVKFYTEQASTLDQVVLGTTKGDMLC